MTLSAHHVDAVTSFLTGKRREKFLASVEVLRAAEARGAWEGRESQKADAGFYQGLGERVTVEVDASDTNRVRELRHSAEMCAQYGRPYSGVLPRVFVSKSRRELPQEVVEAWFKLCWERYELVMRLDEARPKPVVTAIGLSPKVTKTLTEMDLDIVLPSIVPATIEAYKVQARDEHMQPLWKSDGSPKMVTEFRVKWTPGIMLYASRFSGSGGCEACGKPIPSRRFVPIEADCRRNGRVGLWLGCDCARNIFGVKDRGIEKIA